MSTLIHDLRHNFKPPIEWDGEPLEYVPVKATFTANVSGLVVTEATMEEFIEARTNFANKGQ